MLLLLLLPLLPLLLLLLLHPSPTYLTLNKSLSPPSRDVLFLFRHGTKRLPLLHTLPSFLPLRSRLHHPFPTATIAHPLSLTVFSI